MHRAHFSRETHTRAASQQPSSDSSFTEQLQSSHLMPCRSHLLWIIFTIVSWSDDDFRLFYTLLCFNYNDMLLLRRVHTSSMLCIYAERRQNDDKSGWWGREEERREVWKTEIILVFQHVYYIYPPVCRVGNDAVCGRIFVVRFKWFTRRVSIHSLLFFSPIQPPQQPNNSVNECEDNTESLAQYF